MGASIAITGEGIVCAIGNDKAEVLRSLREGHTGIGEMRYLPSVHHELPVGEVKLSDEQMKQMLGMETSLTVSRTTLMAVLAIRQALAQAHISDVVGKRMVLISGTTVADMDITERHVKDRTEALDDCWRHNDCGSNTAEIARYFGSFSDFTTLSTACSSAANAMMLGADMLKAGEADIVVAGGSEALSMFHLNGFNALMILDHHLCKPFDCDRAGLNLGEGAAFVVMEREEDAQKRGADIDAYLTGYANRCDAFHQTASSPQGVGAQLAMRDALCMAGLRPNDIQWVHAHGTGTPNNDASESEAILSVFGSCVPPVSSTKGFTGHTTSASGSISAVISLIAMHEGFVPANLGWHEPMAKGIVPTMGEHDVTLHHVLCNSFGFGGNDSSLVLSDEPTATAEAPELLPEEAVIEGPEVQTTSVPSMAELKAYLRPMEARRMGKLLRSAMYVSLQALKAAGIEQPDAIVTATSWGCLESSGRLLGQLAEGEGMLSPTDFMQSVHNTVGSALAIHLKCHGPNLTLSQNADSLRWACHQARLLLRLGRCKTVLVGCHDERSPLCLSDIQNGSAAGEAQVSCVAKVLSVK